MLGHEPVRVTLPRLGESIVEGTVVRWHVRAGQAVKRGQTLVEIETDKATNEVPSPADGTLEAILVREGETVPVGTAIAEVAELDSGGAGEDTAESAATAPTSQPEGRTGEGRTGRLAPQPPGQRTSPAVRRRAQAEGLDLGGLTGSGRRGRVTLHDLERGRPLHAQTHARADSGWPAVTAEPEDEVSILGPRRRAIGRNLRTSLETAVHVFAVTEIDLGRLEKARKRRSLGLLPFVCRALVDQLRAHPDLNATVQGDQLIRRHRINLGIATDTDRGLMVPVIHDAGTLSLEGFQERIESLAASARAGSLRPEDQADGTFTLSNPGRLGNLFGVSIIRPPEVAILRLGAARKRPVVVEEDGEDRIVIRPIMAAALSYDHRVVDGATGNRFLDALRGQLESEEP